MSVESREKRSTRTPIIIAKVDDRGTRTVKDDRLLAGATFRVARDDGDGQFEAATDVEVFSGVATNGFLVFRTPEVGDYWVIEVDAPSGYELDHARLLSYPITSGDEDCVVFNGHQTCVQDDDATGGFLMLVIADTPAELPPTDTSTR